MSTVVASSKQRRNYIGLQCSDMHYTCIYTCKLLSECPLIDIYCNYVVFQIRLLVSYFGIWDTTSAVLIYVYFHP